MRNLSIAAFAVVISAVASIAVLSKGVLAAPNDGTAENVQGDAPDEAWTEITDRGIEWAPTVILVIGGLFAFALVFGLIYMGLSRARRAMFGGR